MFYIYTINKGNFKGDIYNESGKKLETAKVILEELKDECLVAISGDDEAIIRISAHDIKLIKKEKPAPEKEELPF